MIYIKEMILNCPSCSAKFMVSAAALGAKGRDVKCGKCGHIWFVEPPHDSLDELQNLVDKIEAEASPEVIQPVSPAKQGKEPPEIKLNASPKEILQGKTKSPDAQKESKTSFLSEEQQKIVAGFLLALAVVALITWGILSITRHWYVPQKSQLMIDQLKIDTKEEGLSGTFRVVNLSDTAQDLPTFKVFMAQDDGRIVSTKILKPKESIVQKEASIGFTFTFDDVPSVASKIKIQSQ